jgi:transposase
MPTIREVKTELRHREWAEQIQECQSSGMTVTAWCKEKGMRKSIDGLAALVQQQFQLDLFTSSAFLFCGRRRDRMKVLLWEDDGFLLLYKRLEDGKFSWPRNEQEVRNITREQFIWLTQGLEIDQPKAIKKVAGGVDIC